MLTAIIASLGAINWGAVEFADVDLLTETLALSGDVYAGTIAAIAIAGGVTLYNYAVVKGLDDPLDG